MNTVLQQTTRKEVTMKCVTLVCLLALTSAAVLKPEVEDRTRVKRSDDVSLTSLQTLVENQASVIQSLQTELEVNRNRTSTLESSLHSNYLTLDNNQQTVNNSLKTLQSNFQTLQNKVEAKTRAVAFSARIAKSHDSYTDGLSLGQHQIVPFDETITNVGQAYNTNTGIFTAPVSGTYAFFLSQMPPHNHGNLFLVITKNGATLDEVFAEGGTDIDDQGSSQVTTHMTSGDQVWVRQDSGDAVRGDYWTIFTGYLLQSD